MDNVLIILIVSINMLFIGLDYIGAISSYGVSYKHYRKNGQFYNFSRSSISRSVMEFGRYDMEIAAIQCLLSCGNAAGSPKCVAVNFNTENATCELLSTQPNTTFDLHIISDAKWVLYTEKYLIAQNPAMVTTDGRCGPEFNNRECPIDSIIPRWAHVSPCCSLSGWCGDTEMHCNGIDYRKIYAPTG
ncbi:unnamed protein product [Owenia fusiformis]|uniref:Uncharacterized protein n=1 Tax=Owenia fusiformis TaxID=6347 RepID=A0A8J1Y2K3_OWEFU|nr:unnamed protein product [Owenia fusiformis]